MPPSLSPSAIDKLGRRLAKADIPSEVDLQALATFQREHASALDEALGIVKAAANPPPRSADIYVTHRVKTVETLIDKLRRDTALSRMQDIVGIRMVTGRGLGAQDEIVRRLVERCPEARVDDRRAKPSHGYRAVHVVPRFGGFSVEIQVRTRTQHAWANATEQLADSWGRAIRYGGPPIGASDEVIAERATAMEHWLQISEHIARAEAAAETFQEVVWQRVLVRLSKDTAANEEDLIDQVIDEDPELLADVRAAWDLIVRALRSGGPEVSEALRAALAETGYW